MLNIMMLCHSAGFEHSYLPNAEVAIKELARETGLFNVVTTHLCEKLTPEAFEANDVLIFATTGDLPFDDTQKQSLLDFVKNGKGFFGIHNATDTFHNWPEYGEMIGGYFSGHPWTQDVWVNIEDKNHPATKHLGDAVKLYEEVYSFHKWDREKTHVLMSIDNSSIDLEKGNREDNDYALAWCHQYGKGRVMYSGLGHPDELWSLPWHRQHILGCIKWTAGIEK